MRVAIVDDSAVVRERLIHMLAQHKGVDVIWQAGGVAEALAAFHRRQPEAIILDIQLPDGNGVEVLKEIKKGHPHTLVIVLTNYPIAMLHQRCAAAGADAFLDKSTEFHKVVEVLQTRDKP